MSAQDRGWGPGWPTDRSGDVVDIEVAGVTFPGGVHHRIAELVTILVEACTEDGFEFVDGWCWGFASRPITGTSVPSNHSWGLAVDINAPHNPYTEPWDRPHAEHSIPDWVGATWEHYGFRWGGPAYGDWMHMEWMGTPEEADEATERARRDHGRPPGGPKPNPITPPDDGLTWFDAEELVESLPVLRKGYGYDGTGARGRTHWYVLRVQACLNVSGLSKQVAQDGLFGPATEEMVRELQQRRDIAVDGIVGPVTWRWLMGNDAPAYA